MQLDRLTVHLRKRSSWEAIELGTALVRRHAAAIWKPWLLLTGTVFVAVNAAAWAIDQIWLAAWLMWWLKPVFDRIPLFVISRAAFGDTPSTGRTLRAQWDWGWRPLLSYLTWRRLSPARSVFMPIELLEGGDRKQQRERRRTLGGPVYLLTFLLVLVCVNFELVLFLGFAVGIFFFIPIEYLPESARAAWSLVFQSPPVWVEIGINALVWTAVSIIEPFFVGAGFGLYLNQRAQLEAWDVELVLRKLRKRLTAATVPFALALVWCLSVPGDALAQGVDGGRPVSTCTADSDDRTMHLSEVFGDRFQDPADFQKAAEQAYQDPLLNNKRKISAWRKRNAQAPRELSDLPDFPLAKLIAFIAEWGLWIIVGSLVVLLLATAPRWLPWMRGSFKRTKPKESKIQTDISLVPEHLPDDIVAEARRLWRDDKPRHALALLYRGSVEAMSERACVILPPGATEAQCLRAARKMPDADDRGLFAKMVRIWQYAAYAWKLPDEQEFEALLEELRQRYRWGT
ncbi:MAG: DUF4129 domain-containing protein [Xanthomonadaceae bacterium]|nr:DUF4129 domain-containing protein [Xanthomonadaceae bacterium]